MRDEDFFPTLQAHLKKVDELESMLLKGHLILEQALNNLLIFHFRSEAEFTRLGLSFSRKLDFLAALRGGDSLRPEIAHLRELNRIRNKLAHQIEFAPFHSDLRQWSCDVLGYTPKTISRKATYRTMLSRAIYMLCGMLVGRAMGRTEVE